MPVFGRGWCQKHWTRWRRHGDPLSTIKRMDMSLIERFFDQIEITESCWLWVGPAGENGYGYFNGPAHRWAYQQFVGPIPVGHQIDHTCHNRDSSCRGLGAACQHRRCCNPDHLEAVTQAENIRRALGEQTHCRHGHQLTQENTRVRFHRGANREVRECRKCIASWGKGTAA